MVLSSLRKRRLWVRADLSLKDRISSLKFAYEHHQCFTRQGPGRVYVVLGGGYTEL